MNPIPARQTSSSSPPAEAAARLATIVRMLIAFRDRPADPEATAREYVETTADIPFDALAEACERFKRGRVGDRNNAFAPSTAELCDLAGQIAERSARIFATPRLPPPAHKAHKAVGPMLEKLAEELRMQARETATKDRAAMTPDREEALRRAREQWNRSVEADGGDPYAGEIPVSPALARLVRGGEAA